MKRRTFVQWMSLSGGMMALSSWEGFAQNLAAQNSFDRSKALQAIDELTGEPPAHAEVRTERGGPRLFLNGEEIYPMLALSTHMFPTIENFRQADIHLYHPIVGLRAGWHGPESYDWSELDAFFGQMLALNPKAYFLPRIQLNTPSWWLQSHPEEIIAYGRKTPANSYGVIEQKKLTPSEGGHYYGSGEELGEASFASEVWRQDTAAALRALVRHLNTSPLRSRVIGYMPTTGRTGEWNYFGANFLPDESRPMQRAVGKIPSADARLNTTFGLLRDPEKEQQVIEFYLKFHEVIADTALMMCRTIKEETASRVLCGVFYGYLLEQVRIQDGGYLAPQRFLESDDVDYIAGPYSYQPGNVTDDKGVRFTMQDGAGNRLGHARGLAGDGGFRVMTESLRRHGKLYFSEMDPSTHLDASPHAVIGGHGGLGSDSLAGSLRLLQRDLAQVFACGIGGWLYDFGPLNQAPEGWYHTEPIVREIRRLVALGARRKKLDIGPVAEIAAVYDAKTFAATQHWETERPWQNYGIRYSDFFNHWFLNTQARAFHRLGAPMDFLFHFDLQPADAAKYRLLFMVNVFRLKRDETARLEQLLRDSGATVVWYYAPGFIAAERLDLAQMEALTGFQFRILDSPGSMLIRADFDSFQMRFGVDSRQYPRFAVVDEEAQPLGYWDDTGEVAFAMKAHRGYRSVYTGSAPLPQSILRWLAQQAGTHLWSSEPDIVRATEDAAMLVATSEGARTLRLHKPMAPVEGGEPRREHELKLELGEVRIFVAA